MTTKKKGRKPKSTTTEVMVMPEKRVEVAGPAKPLEGIQNVNPQALIMAAIERNVPMDVLTKLLDMRDRLRKEEAEMAFREAMSNFQAECPVIKKTKSVLNKDKASVRYKYAPLDEIVKVVQPYIKKNGLSYDIESNQVPEGIRVMVRVSHILGHSKETSFTASIDPDAYMTEPQKWASAQTFAKRYAFCNGFGILTGDEDDDGNGAGPGDRKNDAQEQARRDAIAKLTGLPDNIKEGFKILGYQSKAAFMFCEANAWDHKRIMDGLNRIIDSKAAKDE